MKFSIAFFPIGNVNCRMSERTHVLAQQLFGKPSVEQCGLQELQDLAGRYPYFAPAQFLLLEKLKKENSTDHPAQLQKAILYYHNPLEFEYFISSDRFETGIDFEESPQLSTVSPTKEETSFEVAVASEETAVLPEKETDAVFEEPMPSETESVSTVAEEDAQSSGEETPYEAAIASEGIMDIAQQVNENYQEEINIEEPSPEIGIQEVQWEQEDEVIEGPIVSENEIIGTNNEETGQPIAEEKMAESIERVLEQEEKQITASANTNEDLVFEPYHTVDYFASQGIKLSQEEVPKDRFSKQLKSFTEWLRTMKRLPASEVSKNVDASSESTIQHLAEDSVHDASVVTEAMAEVWIKQGNKEKAIETYNKLGLLNPSKKAYFAGLIENLKHS
jgi:hypothetical protein